MTNLITNMQFSNWAKWESRDKKLSNLKHPGIYAIIISEINIEDEPFELIEEICYFGMTNSVAGLKGRLTQFNNSLRDINGGGHGGAERFRYHYKDPADAAILSAKLYVSVFPFECIDRKETAENLRIFGSVAMAEYEAFAQYVEKFQQLPRYNRKKESPKYNHKKFIALQNK
jgi:hypothetical protein